MSAPTPTPKYPGLSTLRRVDSGTKDEAARQKPFPIASNSKAFLGATFALMAADNEFGEKGIESTLEEALESAKSRFTGSEEKTKKIEEFKEMLGGRGFLDVKISDLLTHRSGCEDDNEIALSSRKDQSHLEFFGENLKISEVQKGQHSYSNFGYFLLEDFADVVSSRGGFLPELQSRIIKPLGLKNTGLLEDSPQAKENLGRAIFIPGSKKSPYSDEEVDKRVEFPANCTTPFGPVPAGCGGLYSSIADMEIFLSQTAKMALGQPNALVAKEDLEKKLPLLSSMYRGQLSDSNGYSLGIQFGQNGGQSAMGHRGNFPGNIALMNVDLPYSMEELKSLEPLEPRAKELEPKISMSQFDCTTSWHFTEKGQEIPRRIWQDFLGSKLSEEEQKGFEGAKGEEIEKYLVDQGRLPEGFEEKRDGIFDTTGQAVKNFLMANYLNAEGVIDGARLEADFPTTREVKAVFDKIFEEKKAAVEPVLSELREDGAAVTEEDLLRKLAKEAVAAAAAEPADEDKEAEDLAKETKKENAGAGR